MTVNEYIVKQTLKMFHEIASRLINPGYKLPQGGEPKRIMSAALSRVEKKFGTLTCQRIVDYVVCSAYCIKNRGGEWNLKTVFGPKSLERFNSDKGRLHYENRWLQTENLTRAGLIEYIIDRSEHPKAKFIYIPSEEGTKKRLLNKEVGFVICQNSTLGWSPISEACSQCIFAEKCKQETSQKFPEIYRLRIEYGSNR